MQSAVNQIDPKYEPESFVKPAILCQNGKNIWFLVTVEVIKMHYLNKVV